MSAPKIIIFLPSPPLVKLPLESNPIPYPGYLYLSMSAFLVNLTEPNRQSSNEILESLISGVNL